MSQIKTKPLSFPTESQPLTLKQLVYAGPPIRLQKVTIKTTINLRCKLKHCRYNHTKKIMINKLSH